MTQGQRIRFVREFRHMTQKELGLACGFPKASADVRIRQYESDQKSPKKDALELIALLLYQFHNPCFIFHLINSSLSNISYDIILFFIHLGTKYIKTCSIIATRINQAIFN